MVTAINPENVRKSIFLTLVKKTEAIVSKHLSKIADPFLPKHSKILQLH